MMTESEERTPETVGEIEAPSSKASAGDKELLTELVSTINLREVIGVGSAKLDLSEITREMHEKLVVIAVSCCTNGPVSVGRVTKFPTLEDSTSVKMICPTLTNGTWRQYCRIVANALDEENELVSDCYCITKFGNLWPKCEHVYRAYKGQL